MLAVMANASATPPGNKPVRLAVMEFQTEEGNVEFPALARLCENILLDKMGSLSGLELVEREQIGKIIDELALSAGGSGTNILHMGEMLGADLLAIGNIGTGYSKPRVELMLIEVATGNSLASFGKDLSEPCEISIQALAEDVAKTLPGLVQALWRDNAKPAVAILDVRNISRIRRLDYLEPTIRGVLEEAVSNTRRYRLLRREHVAVARNETELSFSGLTKISDSVFAAKADIALACELEELCLPGQAFQETQLNIGVSCKYRDGRQTKIQVSGKGGDIQGLLKSLMQKITMELGAESMLSAGIDETRVLEALNLFQMAVGEQCWSMLTTAANAPVSDGRGNCPEFLEAFNRDRGDTRRVVSMLERALYLDPGLVIARFFLGLSLWRLSAETPDKIEKRKLINRAAREYEIFLEHGPRGQFRLIAYHDLICMYGSVHEWPRMMQVLESLLAEPPRKKMYDQLHGWGYIYYGNVLHDDEKMKKWTEFINKIYGKEHLQYNVGCPYLELAAYFLREKKPEKALAWYEHAGREHGCGLTSWCRGAYGYEILESIYKALGMTNQGSVIADIRHARENKEMEESMRSWRNGPRQMTNVVPLLPELNAELKNAIRALDEEHSIRAMGFHSGGTYVFTVSGRCMEGYSDGAGWAKDRYETNRLLYWPGAGRRIVELSTPDLTASPRITCILPYGDYIYFGAHEGLARYHPRTGRWKWYSEKEGLPERKILCGVSAGDELWFGGLETVFSFNPTNEIFRTYLPDVDPNSGFLWIESMPDGISVYNLWSHYFIDRITGKWSDATALKTKLK